MMLDQLKQERLERDIDEFKIFSEVFDASTLMVIYDLLNTGKISAVHGCIKMGKEACIHLAESKGRVVILKIYRIATSDFRSMWQYLQGDPRFGKLGRNRRQVICSWASREFRNLGAAYEAGCKCPRPIAFRKNVLIMQCIKRKRFPAPRLIDIECTELLPVFQSVVASYEALYRKAGMVHGDLSAYNILMSDEGPVLIDFSQGTVTDNPKAVNLLFRDMETLLPYFRKAGVQMTEQELAERISGKQGISPDNTLVI